MLAYLAQHPEQRQQLVDDPSLIPHAVEEMLRWESPVQGVIRITTQETELAGCPIGAHQLVSVMIGSANTDEKSWERADEVDFDARGQQAHRLRRRRPPLPRFAPRPHGAARRPRGVARRHPGVLAARGHRAPLLARPPRPSRTSSWSGERRSSAAHRRQARRRRSRRHLRQHQPGHRAGARTGGGRHGRRHDRRHRGRPTRLRHHDLVHRPRLPARLPAPAAGGHRVRAGGAARRARGRGRLPRPHHLRAPARRPAPGGAALAGRADRDLPVDARRSAPRTPSAWAGRPSARCGGRPSASSASSCRGTSRSRSS